MIEQKPYGNDGCAGLSLFRRVSIDINDLAAIDALQVEILPRLFEMSRHFCRRYGLPLSDAEDIAVTVFGDLVLDARRKGFFLRTDTCRGFYGYLEDVVANTVKKELRKNLRRDEVYRDLQYSTDDTYEQQQYEEEVGPSDTELVSLLFGAVNDQTKSLILERFEGASLRRLAAITGLQQSTIAKRITRGISKMIEFAERMGYDT